MSFWGLIIYQISVRHEFGVGFRWRAAVPPNHAVKSSSICLHLCTWLCIMLQIKIPVTGSKTGAYLYTSSIRDPDTNRWVHSVHSLWHAFSVLQWHTNADSKFSDKLMWHNTEWIHFVISTSSTQTVLYFSALEIHFTRLCDILVSSTERTVHSWRRGTNRWEVYANEAAAKSAVSVFMEISS